MADQSNGAVKNGSITSKILIVGIAVVVVAGVAGAAFNNKSATEILAFCTLVVMSLLGRLQQLHTAAEVQKVKETSIKIHEESNSAKGLLLDSNAVLARGLAISSPNEKNIKAAEFAEKKAQLHAREQVAAAEQARKSHNGIGGM